jgi:anti-sigma factor RsiW
MKHLDDHQISAALAGLDLDREVDEHLASCVECRGRVASMGELIADRRHRILAEEPDWIRQRAAVLDRLPGASSVPASSASRRWWRPALAAAAAVVVVAGLSLLGPRSVERTAANGEIPVAEILAEMDALLEDDSIPGFEVIDPGLEGLEGMIVDPSS